MHKGIDSDKAFDEAVLNIVKNEDFKNISVEMIESIASFAVHYAQAGYDRGYSDGSLKINEFVASGAVDSIEKAERLIEAATAFKNKGPLTETISLQYPKDNINISFEIKVNKNDATEIAEKIKKQITKAINNGAFER